MAIVTNGTAYKTDVHQRVVARFEDLVSHLVEIHCIAHREALATKDVNDEFQYFGFIDRAANKVYEWLGRSVIRRGMLVKLLLAFCEETRVILYIHFVWWYHVAWSWRRWFFLCL